MSNFNSQEINFMKRRGNKACGKIYLALCNGKEPDECENNFDDYLRLKYQVQKWYVTALNSDLGSIFGYIDGCVFFSIEVSQSRS